MTTKAEFMESERSRLSELIERLKGHRYAIEERLKQQPEDDEIRDLLEDAEEGIEALEPILAESQKDSVDPDAMVQYAKTIEEWEEKEAEIAERLK